VPKRRARYSITVLTADEKTSLTITSPPDRSLSAVEIVRGLREHADLIEKSFVDSPTAATEKK
jgi:hypothetical protein